MLQIVFQARLRTHTPEAYALISNMMFTQQEYEDLLRLYNSIEDKENNSGKVYEEVTTTIMEQFLFQIDDSFRIHETILWVSVCNYEIY